MVTALAGGGVVSELAKEEVAAKRQRRAACLLSAGAFPQASGRCLEGMEGEGRAGVRGASRELQRRHAEAHAHKVSH